MNFEDFRAKAQEVLGGYNETLHVDEIEDIKSLYHVLLSFHESQIEDGAKPEDQPLSPFNKFKAYMLSFLEESGIEAQDLDEYAAFHCTKGSTPTYSRIKAFDLPGDLIRNQFKQFALREYPELFEEVE